LSTLTTARPTDAQALNSAKALLAGLEQEGVMLLRDVGACRQELDGFERNFSQTLVQAGAVEKVFQHLQAEQRNV
jgi:hypothetical protein